MNKKNITDSVLEELRRRSLFEQNDDDDDDDDDDNDNDVNNQETSLDHNEDFCEMACQILHSQKQSHIFHLGTKSFAEHMALNGYYGEIDELVDGLIESFQGKYGLLTNYKSYKVQPYKNKKQVLKYFAELLNVIEEKRDCCDDSYIQNQIDTIQELIYSTLYKLKFLA